MLDIIIAAIESFDSILAYLAHEADKAEFIQRIDAIPGVHVR